MVDDLGEARLVHHPCHLVRREGPLAGGAPDVDAAGVHHEEPRVGSVEGGAQVIEGELVVRGDQDGAGVVRGAERVEAGPHAVVVAPDAPADPPGAQPVGAGEQRRDARHRTDRRLHARRSRRAPVRTHSPPAGPGPSRSRCSGAAGRREPQSGPARRSRRIPAPARSCRSRRTPAPARWRRSSRTASAGSSPPQQPPSRMTSSVPARSVVAAHPQAQLGPSSSARSSRVVSRNEPSRSSKFCQSMA